MFFRILVPLDGSKLAQSALPYALALASAVDAPITLLSVVPPMQMLTDYYVPYNAATEAVQLADAGDALDALAQSLRTHGVRVTTAVAVGDAADQILRYADENAMDAIVMASHGRGGAFHWAFGSVARKVITGATVPTLVVRAKDAPEHPETPARVGRILVPLDGSELAEAVTPARHGSRPVLRSIGDACSCRPFSRRYLFRLALYAPRCVRHLRPGDGRRACGRAQLPILGRGTDTPSWVER